MARSLDTFHSEYLYRVLRPNESPDKNLVCCDRSSLRTIDQHVETGLNDPSRFISTTSDFNAALKWLNKANEKCIMRYLNVRKVIVRIDVKLLKWKYSRIAAYAYDLSNSFNRNLFLKTEKQKKFSESYHEVVFIDEIPSDVFSTYYILGEGFVRNQASNKTASSISSFTSIKPPSLLQSAFSMGDISELGETSNSQISSTSGLSFQPVNKHSISAFRTSLPTAGGTSDRTTPVESKYLHSAQSYARKNYSDSVAAHSRISSASGLSFIPVNKPSSDALKTNTPNSGATRSSEPDPLSYTRNYVQYASPTKRIQTIQEIDSKEAANRRMLFASFKSPLLSNKPHVDTLRANEPILSFPCPTPSAQSSIAMSKYVQPPYSSMSKIISTTHLAYESNSPSPSTSSGANEPILCPTPSAQSSLAMSKYVQPPYSSMSKIVPTTHLAYESNSPSPSTSSGANEPILCPTPSAQSSLAMSKYLQPPYSSMSKIVPTTHLAYESNSPSPLASIDTLVALKSESNVNPNTQLTKSFSFPYKTTSIRQEIDSSKFSRNILNSQTSYKPILYPPSHQTTALINKPTRKTVRPINSAENRSPYEPTSKKSASPTFLSHYIQSSNSREIKAYPKMIADINESNVGSPKSTLLPTPTDSAGTSQFKLHNIDEAFAQSRKDIPSTLDVNYKQLDSDFEASMKIVRKSLLLHKKLFRLN